MNLKTILIIAGCSYIFPATAQERTMELSLDETVKLAKLQSPDAQTARHSFRSAYWNYKYYRANYLPALSLTSDPNLNRAINKVTLGDREVCRTKHAQHRPYSEFNTEHSMDRRFTVCGNGSTTNGYLQRPHDSLADFTY